MRTAFISSKPAQSPLIIGWLNTKNNWVSKEYHYLILELANGGYKVFVVPFNGCWQDNMLLFGRNYLTVDHKHSNIITQYNRNHIVWNINK